MVTTIFVKQDKSFLSRLLRAAVIFENVPNALLLQVWTESPLASNWLRTLSFELIGNGTAVKCKAKYLGRNTGAELFTLVPCETGVDLKTHFSVGDDAVSNTVSSIKAMTPNGHSVELANENVRPSANPDDFSAADITWASIHDIRPVR